VGKILVYFLAAALTLAHRALAAALILAMPAAEIRRFGRVVVALAGALFCFAHRARCAAAMRRRADADIVRVGGAFWGGTVERAKGFDSLVDAGAFLL
jgi:hypothetical protein